jgi:hypothetical protein
MAKLQTVGKFSEVINTDWHINKTELVKSLSRAAEAFGKTTVGMAAFVPVQAFAASAKAVNSCVQSGASSDTFLNLHGSIMTLFDGGVVLIIIFAGAMWAMKHRSAALETLIGCGAGYLLARHAIDIRDVLSCI